MTDVLVEFDSVLRYDNHGTWSARACTFERPDGLWEGWLEFTPRNGDGGAPVHTGRETEQSNREAVLYWAEGLTQVYLEGALVRAITSSRPRPRPAGEINIED